MFNFQLPDSREDQMTRLLQDTRYLWKTSWVSASFFKGHVVSKYCDSNHDHLFTFKWQQWKGRMWSRNESRYFNKFLNESPKSKTQSLKLLNAVNKFPALNDAVCPGFRVCWQNHKNVISQMKASEQYFPVILFIALYWFNLKCDHSNESYWAVLSCGAVYYAVQGALTFESVRMKS